MCVAFTCDINVIVNMSCLGFQMYQERMRRVGQQPMVPPRGPPPQRGMNPLDPYDHLVRNTATSAASMANTGNTNTASLGTRNPVSASPRIRSPVSGPQSSGTANQMVGIPQGGPQIGGTPQRGPQMGNPAQAGPQMAASVQGGQPIGAPPPRGPQMGSPPAQVAGSIASGAAVSMSVTPHPPTHQSPAQSLHVCGFTNKSY